MDKKNKSRDYTQLSLFEALGLSDKIDSEYSSEDIEEVIYKLREAKHFAEKREENERRCKEKKKLSVKHGKKKNEQKHMSVK